PICAHDDAAAEQDRLLRQPLERRAVRDANGEILTARRSCASIELRCGGRRHERRGAGADRARDLEPVAADEPARRMEKIDVADAVAGIERTLDVERSRMPRRDDGALARAAKRELDAGMPASRRRRRPIT